jgi:pimeloyl-ACP methyl ester carboxylesterase
VTVQDFELQHVAIHGHDVAFRTDGSGPVLLLVHGMASSSATWLPVLPALAENFTVVAPDLLGHGESAKPRSDYSLGAHASGLRDLLVMLGHDRVTPVGRSFGGGVVMQFAYQFPDWCERMVLVSSGGLGDEVNAMLRILALPGAEYLLPPAFTMWVHDTVGSITSGLRHVGVRPGPGLTEAWDSYASLVDPAARSAFFNTLRSVVDPAGQRVSATDRLYLTSLLPTLIMWGEKDRIIPVSHAHATHDAIPGSRLEVFEGAGHYLQCERPERFAEVLTGFMHSTSPATISRDRWKALLREHGHPTSDPQGHPARPDRELLPEPLR